jgi:hypothetical protein
MRMAGDDDAALLLGALEHLFDCAVGRDEFVDAEGQHVRGVLAGDAVLGELEAGDHDHAVAVEGALFLALDLLAVRGEVLAGHGEAEAVRDLADHRVGVDHVIGDGDDVMTGTAEEVDDLSDRQLSVRPGGVDVKVGEQHGPQCGPGHRN